MPTALTQLEHELERGPLTLFGHFLIRSAAIHLHDTAVLWLWSIPEHDAAVQESRRSALQAAAEITELARMLRRLSYFRVRAPAED